MIPQNKKIIANAVLRWTGEILNKLIWMLFFVFLARFLGSREFGYFNYAFSFGGIFVILTDFGTNTLITREVSGDNSKANFFFFNTLCIKLALSVICMLLVVAVSFLFSDVPLLVILFTFSLVIASFWDPIDALFRAYKELYYEALIMLIWRVLLVAGSLAGIYYLKFDLARVALVFIAGSIITLAAAVLLIKRTHGIKFLDFSLLDTASWKKIAVSSLPIAAIILAGGFILKFNVVLLQHFRTAEEVGLYSAAFKLIESTLFVPSFFVASVFPFLCERNKEKILSHHGLALFRKSFIFLFAAAVLISTVTYPFADKIILLFYGAQFAESAVVFKILIWVVVFMSLNELFYHLYLSVDRQKRSLIFMLVALAGYLALCYYLIPNYGFIGASWALLITQMLYFIQNFAYLKRIR